MEAVMKDPILFGDYKTALSESEPRVYEDIQGYDASKALFQVKYYDCYINYGVPILKAFSGIWYFNAT